MMYIAHRVNTVEELDKIAPEFGVEIDLRSKSRDIIVQHEPFVDGILFKDWIKAYHHRFIILNIKEEGIEYEVKNIVESSGIRDFFFLDLSFPYLIKMVNSGEKRVAVRFSEYESINTVINLAEKVDWVWVDCFKYMPLGEKEYEILSKDFKICLVSPELQGRDVSEIKEYKSKINNFNIDAVCTKRIDLWFV